MRSSNYVEIFKFSKVFPKPLDCSYSSQDLLKGPSMQKIREAMSAQKRVESGAFLPSKSVICIGALQPNKAMRNVSSFQGPNIDRRLGISNQEDTVSSIEVLQSNQMTSPHNPNKECVRSLYAGRDQIIEAHKMSLSSYVYDWNLEV